MQSSQKICHSSTDVVSRNIILHWSCKAVYLKSTCAKGPPFCERGDFQRQNSLAKRQRSASKNLCHSPLEVFSIVMKKNVNYVDAGDKSMCAKVAILGLRLKRKFCAHLVECAIFKRNFFPQNDNGTLPKFYATVARNISLKISH